MQVKRIFSLAKTHRKQIFWWALFIVGSTTTAFSVYLRFSPVIIPETVLNTKVHATLLPSYPSKYPDFGLVIPKISSDLPVVPDVNGENKDEYIAALDHGVAHFKGTAKPDKEGNVFIYGHSSYLRRDKSNYKTAFAKLPELKAGDNISIWYQNKEYHYMVDSTQVVDSKEVSWLNQTSEKTLTLMTCFPIGTDKQRLIIRAKSLEKNI